MWEQRERLKKTPDLQSQISWRRNGYLGISISMSERLSMRVRTEKNNHGVAALNC